MIPTDIFFGSPEGPGRRINNVQSHCGASILLDVNIGEICADKLLKLKQEVLVYGVNDRDGS